MFRSTDNGANWVDFSGDLGSTFIFSLAVSGSNLFAGTNGRGVWRLSI